ncbi:Riboflavin synthase [Marinomonas spartinae]|uniref:Riboflavin synthase n=1 Tax=Marinomonas spartinae TaxID=1792290 RepID=A0A1A8TT52_9GAMM|nr:riboflavin synthase [Marinomonas spartinae]SBS29656.1 Riboflavin synthase [Marinomonas spartinae]SBS36898.1 Riboflavin synthase [Marinomonas spartinae]
MFTGIIKSVARIIDIEEKNGIKTFQLEFKENFCEELEIGASVAVDGVCLTVTEIITDKKANFDIMLQSLIVTTLNTFENGTYVNVERAAKDGAEIGGHPLSGHIDFKTKILNIKQDGDNYCLRIHLPSHWKKYIFPKGYIAINGASLTLSEVDKENNWFEVWLIPETRKSTTFELKSINDYLNIEIERGTQVVVDTIKDTLHETLGDLLPIFEKLLESKGIDINKISQEATVKLNKINS